jgi:glycosyltransferase involved in cell wall biosynthesis
MEDWFSEDLLPEARRHRPLGLLRSLEREVLSRGVHASCPSRAMSEALVAAYGCPPPAVVYNAFAWSDRHLGDGTSWDRRKRPTRSLHWFSTTLGPGRGLEELLTAVALLDRDLVLHLRGRPAPGFAEWIKARIPERRRDRVQLHPLVANDQLLPCIAEHDIGFAGEQPDCRSRDLTVTNKMLHYLLAGLAVVASDTKGQCEVASQASGAVFLYPAGDVRALAGALDRLLGSRDALAQAKASALAAARDIFCWERQEPVLLDAIERAVARPERVSR